MPTLGLKGPGLAYQSPLAKAGSILIDFDPFGIIPSEESIGTPLVLLSNGAGGGFHTSQLIINGVDRSLQFSVEGCDARFQLNGVAGTMSLRLADTGASFRVQVTPGRQTIYWIRFGQLFFAGYISSRRETFQNSAGTNIMYQVLDCTDWGIRLAERIVQHDFLEVDGYGTLSSIVTAIMAEYMTPEGFALSLSGDPGVDLGDQKLAGQTVASAFQALAGATGWDFYVDNYKTVWWFDPSLGRSVAPFTITDNNGLFSSLEVSERMGKYRDVQWIMSTVSPEALRTDTFTITTLFPVFELGGSPMPRPGYINPRILGDDEAVDMVASDGRLVTMFGDWQTGWAWALERPTATTPWRVWWNSALGPQIIGDVISFTYPVPEQEAVMIRRENSSEISARQAVEGGTGIIEDLQTVNGGDRPSLEEYADALLRRFGPDGMMKQVTIGANHYTAAHQIYEPGMLTTLSHLRPLVSGTFLVESTSLREEGGTVVRWTAVLQLIGHYGNWISTQAELLKRLQPVQQRRIEKYVFTIAETVNGLTNPGLAINDQSNTTHTVTTSGILKAVGLHFQDDPPTLATVIIDVQKALAATPTVFNSIFNPLDIPPRVQYPPSATTEQIVRKFLVLNMPIAKGDRIKWVCLQGDATAMDGVLVVEVLV